MILFTIGIMSLASQICSITKKAGWAILPSHVGMTTWEIIDMYVTNAVQYADTAFAMFILSYLGNFVFFGCIWMMTGSKPSMTNKEESSQGDLNAHP